MKTQKLNFETVSVYKVKEIVAKIQDPEKDIDQILPEFTEDKFSGEIRVYANEKQEKHSYYVLGDYEEGKRVSIEYNPYETNLKKNVEAKKQQENKIVVKVLQYEVELVKNRLLFWIIPNSTIFTVQPSPNKKNTVVLSIASNVNSIEPKEPIVITYYKTDEKIDTRAGLDYQLTFEDKHVFIRTPKPSEKWTKDEQINPENK